LPGVSRTSNFSSFFHFPEESAGSFRGPREFPHGSQRAQIFEIFQLFPSSSRVVRVGIVYRPSPGPPGALSEFAGLLPEFSEGSGLNFQAFRVVKVVIVYRPSPGPPGMLSEFAGLLRGPGVLGARIHRRFQGLPERLSEFAGLLRGSHEFPPEFLGSHPGF